MAYLREEQRSADAADGRASASSNGAAPSSVYTMDRLRRLGAELQACPYFATRLLLRGADVVFVPYGYLLDESQRAVLLGGSATNPATASEAAAVFSPFSCRPISADEAGGGGGGVTTDESGSLRDDVAPHGHSSLGAVLYHRRQRVTATEAFRRKRAQHQQQQRDSNSGSAVAAYTRGGAAHASSEKEVDTIWRAMARSAPPSLTGDVLVFDEAHNIADHCRSISSVSVSPWQLQLARKLFETYLERYASRLLTRNKQRLRELIRFLGHLLRFCEHAGDAVPLGDDGGGEGNVPPSTTRPTAVHARVFSFNAFLFDADIDNVDVYAFLTFLVDSQLLIKLQGFVSYTLEAELQQEEEKKRRKAVTTAANTTVNISGTDNSLFSTAGVKRQRSSRIGVGLSNPRDEAQRQHQFLESISLPGDKKENADEKLSHPSLAELLSQQLQSAGAAPTAAAMAVAASASAVAPSADPAQLRALSTEALQRVERFLCALYTSDTTTTRVVWVVPPPRHAGSVMRQGTLKVIQLEPGMHTFTPLVMEARAVVLAGGTMQPLAFTCGPLLPPPSPAMTGRDAGGDDPHANFNGRSSAAVAANVIDGGESVKKIDPPLSSGAGCTSSPPCFHLISEGHVVPPSSVQVWALGTGPSGLRMELSQQALGLRSDASSAISDASSQRMGTSSTMSPHAHRMLAEIGSTLLNLARVLPPAGAICFFTSYDLMDATVSVLEHTGYYAQINEVKRIFMETRNGRGTGSGTDCGGGEAMARLLREYQDWICCERDNHSDVACKVELSTTATSPPLCNAAAPQHLPGPPRRGAFLFAVMGGRLSEGINFSDDLGRAVVVLGMPYANPTDVELQMNLQHIVTTRLRTKVDAGRQGRCELAGPVGSSPFTCAEEWGLYMDGMMRTVNQCIGRCIRHAGDYATIILLDARYAERQDVRRRVSAWLQPSIRVAQTFGQCFSGVREFFVGRQRKG
ncbi:hypothetical protein JKF63_07746 [Porcisia hertigi]|uniref:Helicase ATP-binding domain-containing protein n=1 Tax=Porcisia hertigi TaxID=2761500 RepID=A0A836YI74_9TRYP|nr:hypothetical protein JKF63_07746 [Porcisia hertigi]